MINLGADCVRAQTCSSCSVRLVIINLIYKFYFYLSFLFLKNEMSDQFSCYYYDYRMYI